MFIFTHIEKSGGISLHTMLHNSFSNYISPRPQVNSDFLLPEHIERIQRMYPFQIDGFGGHKLCPALPYEDCIDEPIVYFTFLREPVKRFLSHVNWQINIKGNNDDLSYYLENPYFHNFQCYRISGRDVGFESAREVIEKKKIQLGLMEKYEQSLFNVKDLLPQFEPLNLKMNDKSSGYGKFYSIENLKPGILEKIKSANEFDLKLYEYATKRFQSTSSATNTQFGKLKSYTNFKRKISNRLVTLLIK
jgi:hypothetical protein